MFADRFASFPDWVAEKNVTIMHNERVLGVEPSIDAIVLTKRRVVQYKKCLIASGTTPVLPTFDIDDEAPVTYFEKV
jgi:NAD(P)H-nitrite reductase large subunit